MNKWLAASSMALVFTVTGCAQIKPLPPSVSTTEHIIEKSYEKNLQQTVYVGQPIVKVKDYYSVESTTPYLEVSNDFEVTGILGLKFPGKAGSKAHIRGETTYKNKKYKTVIINSSPCFTGLIDEHGVFNSTMLSGMGCSEINPWTWEITPASTRFNVVSNKSVDKTAGFVNYELLYGGTNGNSFSVTYREYTPDNFARPAFYQDLTFSNSSQYIRYKNMRIKVHQVNNEQISYTVVED